MRRASTIAIIAWLMFAASPARGSEFFVAPAGNDGDPGTIERPFATIQRAQSAASPGDTVSIRGGMYAMDEARIARRRGIWADVTSLDKGGEPGRRINYWAYRDERPVFDFSAVKPAGVRVDAFYISGSWIHIKGLEVIGVQVTLKGHTQSICFENDGSHNIYEQISMHDGQAIGIYSVRGSDNLFLNCDAYRNHDVTSEDGKGGNVDGFGCHPPKGATGNVFRGCRAWFNSDDGYDCIGARESVTFENSWAAYNGFSPKFDRLADGNGFKAGGYGSTPADRLPDPIPRHVVRACVAVGNKASGFYANHHPGGGDWFNNTGYRNGTDFNMLGRLLDNRTDVDGSGHSLRNNVAYKGRAPISRIDLPRSDSTHNTFTLGLRLRDEDFVNLDESELIRPRQADGSLPAIGFLRPARGGSLIDKGIGVGLPFLGPAPDLGAFETSASAAIPPGTGPIDVYLIGGQSNATGQGYMANLPKDFAPDVRVTLFHSGRPHLNSGEAPRTWMPLRQASESPDRFGPELGFGNRLRQLRPDREIALIKHAQSGSNLIAQWNPGVEAADRDHFGPQFKIFVETVELGLAGLRERGYDPTLRGMIWQQGESDSKGDDAGVYGANLAHFIGRVREQFHAPDLVFVYGYVMPPPNKGPGRDLVRKGQKEVDQDSGSPLAVKGAHVVETDDLSQRADDPNTPLPGDHNHFGTAGTLGLGRRMAETMDAKLGAPR